MNLFCHKNFGFVLCFISLFLLVSPIPKPPPHQLPYDGETALRYLRYSAISFCPLSSIEDWNCEQCSKFLPFFQLTDILSSINGEFGYVGVDTQNQEIMIVFRGSANLENWIRNLEAWHTMEDFANIKGAKVDSGFYHAYLDIREQLVFAIGRLNKKYPNYPIVSTAHSFGATLALFSAVDMATIKTLPVETRVSQLDSTFQIPKMGDNNSLIPVRPTRNYVFGLPRTGNIQWATWATSTMETSYFLANAKDIVVHLPLEEMGYHHVSQEVWYPKDLNMTYIVCNGSGEDPNCSDSVTIPDPVDHMKYLSHWMNCTLPKLN